MSLFNRNDSAFPCDESAPGFRPGMTKRELAIFIAFGGNMACSVEDCIQTHKVIEQVDKLCALLESEHEKPS